MNKLLKTLIASVLLCSVSLLGVFASSCKKTNAELPKIEEDVLTKIESGVTDGDGNKLEEDEVYAMPRNMVFSAPATLSDEGISEQSLTSVTVTATLEPVGANEPVDWSVAFQDEWFSWTSGKIVTDYVTVTPTTDGSLTATVRFLQIFKDSIILTCSLRSDSSIKAKCVIDCFFFDEDIDYLCNMVYAKDVYDLESEIEWKSLNYYYGDNIPSAGYDGSISHVYYGADSNQYRMQFRYDLYAEGSITVPTNLEGFSTEVNLYGFDGFSWVDFDNLEDYDYDNPKFEDFDINEFLRVEYSVEDGYLTMTIYGLFDDEFARHMGEITPEQVYEKLKDTEEGEIYLDIVTSYNGEYTVRYFLGLSFENFLNLSEVES